MLLTEIAILYCTERHRELIARTNFLLSSKLQVEKEEVETMRGINKILLVRIIIFKKSH